MITMFDMASGENDVAYMEPMPEQPAPVQLQDDPMMRVVPRLMTLAEAVEMERNRR